MNRHPSRKAFSRVELLVVLLCGALFMGVFLPMVRSAQEKRVSRENMNNLKQVNLAILNSHDTYGKLPPAFDKFGGINAPVSVHVHILPFIEQITLYQKFLKNEGKGPDDAIVPTFLTGDDPSKHDRKGIVNYAANLRVFSTKGLKAKYNENMEKPGATEPGATPLVRGIPDGTSNTIGFANKYGACDKGGSKYIAAPNSPFAPFFGQNAAKVKADATDKTATFQTQPAATGCCTSPLMAQSFTSDGLLVGLMDGSVRVVSPKISPETWNRALQPNDGMPLGNDF